MNEILYMHVHYILHMQYKYAYVNGIEDVTFII